MKHAAEHWSSHDGGVRCGLCPHSCLIHDGNTGVCRVRSSSDGALYSQIYGEVSSLALDPIEKKPLYHFHPGSMILSAGTVGCNMKCPYCQNWQISQCPDHETEYISPENLVSLARKKRSIGLAYTYSEPIVWFEYVRDCAALARKAGLVNVMVSNGYISPAPLAELAPLIDAWNIDLKTFSSETYKTVQHGDLASVQSTISALAGKTHLELTTLLVTGINDTVDEMDQLTDWVASVDDAIPLHFSRYFPNYSYDSRPTDIDDMMEIYLMAKKKLRHVYCGNITGHTDTQQTICRSCGAILVSRSGFSVSAAGLDGSRCSSCGACTDIVI
jgi:pyruvate formate lyase activating enzyme